MAITQLSCRVHLIPRADTMHVDIEEVKKAIINGRLKALILTTPCNPTGTIVPRETLQKIADACATSQCALIVDNTYSDFVFGSVPNQPRIVAPNVFNVYSFSKNYGMSGWRMGYVIHHEQFAETMLKVS